MEPTIQSYNRSQNDNEEAICEVLASIIQQEMQDATSKIWHGSPVWFLSDNPIVGYGVLKDCVRLLFWSGQSFDEPGLQKEGSFKASEARYTSVEQVNIEDMKRWLSKSKKIQWDYKNIVRRRGVLERLEV